MQRTYCYISSTILTIFFTVRYSILFIICLSLSAYGQKPKNYFELKGHIRGLDSGMMYLGYYINKEQKVVNDSSVIKYGAFSFKGNITEPTVAFIKSSRRGILGISLTEIFIEPSVMQITLENNKFGEPHLTGSAIQKEYAELRNSNSSLRSKCIQINDLLRSDQFAGNRDSLKFLLRSTLDSLNRNEYNFFSTHPTSYITAYLLQSHIRNLSLDSLTLFYSRLGDKLQQNIVVKYVSEKIQQIKDGSVGSIGKAFVAKDVNGNYVMSHLLKGKYVLLDFWATWCIPCRKNSPHLIAIYNQYKKNGLTILGISSDRDTLAWKKAIFTDGTGIWTHILNGNNRELKFKGSITTDKDISEKFGVGLLPTYILINPEGIIVGRYQENLDDLDKKLATIFK